MVEHALVRQARALDAQARHHKRAANEHRQAAKAARARQAEIEAQCARLGIAVVYSDDAATKQPPSTRGAGNLHGQETTS